MTKSQLVAHLVANFNLSQTQATHIVNELFEIIVRDLLSGDRFEIRGFGNFHLKHSKPRITRNPKTQKTIAIGERRGVAFKPSPILLKRLNNEDNKN